MSTVASIEIPARDGYRLSGTVHEASSEHGAVVISSAMAVPHHYYGGFASYLAGAGWTTVTFDYRGIGASRAGSLRNQQIHLADWIFSDMAGVLDWSRERWGRVGFVGHSLGGQVAGLLDNSDLIRAMVTFSSQSGHWRMQGGEQKPLVAFHVYVTLPLLASALGYVPWSRFSSAEDLPAGVARDWARWCRRRRYLRDDPKLPLERYSRFEAPVLAYSFADDKWGTPESVDDMMSVYPNLERRHVDPADHGLDRVGHMGFFRSSSQALWPAVVEWLAR